MQKRLLGIKSNLLLLFRQYYALHNLRIRVTIAEAEAIYTYILDNADTQHDVYPQPRRVELFKRVAALYLDENPYHSEKFKILLNVFTSRGERVKADVLKYVLSRIITEQIKAKSEQLREKSEQAKNVIEMLRQTVLSGMKTETPESLTRILLQTLADVDPDLDIQLTREVLMESGTSEYEVKYMLRIMLLFQIIIGDLKTADESQITLFTLVFHVYLSENSYCNRMGGAERLIKVYTSSDMHAEAAFIKECLEKSATEFFDSMVGVIIHIP